MFLNSRSHTILLSLLTSVASIAALPTPAQAKLDDSCVIAYLNRTTRVREDGSWRINNLPSSFGAISVRATCVRDGLTLRGQSVPLEILPGEETGFEADLQLGSVAPKEILAPPNTSKDQLVLSEPSSIETGWSQFYDRSASEVVALLDANDINLVVVNRLRELEDPIAIPALQSAFEQAESQTERLVIASALVRLRTEDVRYFELLERRAKVAASSDMPFPTTVSADGEISQTISPRFIAWCKAHDLEPAEAWRRMIYEYVAAIKMLAMAGDLRSVPTLMSILQSENYLFIADAAAGLAYLQKKSAISEIIAAADRAPKSTAWTIARSLLAFDSSQAQEAATRLIPAELLEELRRRIAEKGPSGVFF